MELVVILELNGDEDNSSAGPPGQSGYTSSINVLHCTSQHTKVPSVHILLRADWRSSKDAREVGEV